MNTLTIGSLGAAADGGVETHPQLLEEVAELLALDHMQDRQAARALAQSKLPQIDDRIRRMGAMRGALASLVSCCENAPGSDPCPILRALAGKTHPT